jgi:hypothetical protein
MLTPTLFQTHTTAHYRFDTGGQGIGYNDVTTATGTTQLRSPDAPQAGGSGLVGYVGMYV